MDAEKGTRQPAFDHEAVAKKIGGAAEATRLPIDALRFSEDGKVITLLGPEKSWELNLSTGDLRESSADKPAAEGLPAETQPALAPHRAGNADHVRQPVGASGGGFLD